MLMSHFQIAALFLIGLLQKKEQIVKGMRNVKSKKRVVFYDFEIIHKKKHAHHCLDCYYRSNRGYVSCCLSI